jgi:hypothetical protein
VLDPAALPDFSTMEFTPENAVSNLEKCFLAAEARGISKLLDGEDIAVCPDSKSLSTYLMR